LVRFRLSLPCSRASELIGSSDYSGDNTSTCTRRTLFISFFVFTFVFAVSTFSFLIPALSLLYHPLSASIPDSPTHRHPLRVPLRRQIPRKAPDYLCPGRPSRDSARDYDFAGHEPAHGKHRDDSDDDRKESSEAFRAEAIRQRRKQRRPPPFRRPLLSLLRPLRLLLSHPEAPTPRDEG
jgi:hypothetical protein